MEFFQQQCDMITLQLFQDKPRSIVPDLSYMHDLFISYTYESSVAVVQSWRDHGHRDIPPTGVS